VNSSVTHSAWNSSKKWCVRYVKPTIVRHGKVNDEPDRSIFVILGVLSRDAAFTLNRVPSKLVENIPHEK
jgi:hypothetical protein